MTLSKITIQKHWLCKVNFLKIGHILLYACKVFFDKNKTNEIKAHRLLILFNNQLKCFKHVEKQESNYDQSFTALI